jgi:hypothetical protein
MTQPAKSQEPSMEEILASIRRIIADDDATKPAAAPEPPPAAAAPPPMPSLRAAAPPRPQPIPPPAAAPEPSAALGKSPFSGAAAAAPSSRGAVAEQSADILDLTESMAAPAPGAAPQFRTIDGSFDVGYEEAAEKPAAPHRSLDGNQLLSRSATAAVDSAFNSLAQTVLVQNARTLEDLVREMLRPLLKSWLDDNLPSMVERLVRSEIDRVSRGRAG